mgnify:CR=1 FL=1
MVDVSSVALSGLFANEKRIAVAASNIANLNTNNYNAQELQQSSNAAGGELFPEVLLSAGVR